MALLINHPVHLFHRQIAREYVNENFLTRCSQNESNLMTCQKSLPKGKIYSPIIFQWAVTSFLKKDDDKQSQKKNGAPIILSGWLRKMKHKSKIYSTDWNKRWVTIENGAILWRHSKDDDVTGCIELQLVSDVYKVQSLNDSSYQSQRNIFVIKSKKRTLCLMAKNEEECEKWIRSIQLQTDLKSGGTASGPAVSKNRRKSNGGGDKFEVRKYSDINYHTNRILN